MIVPLLALARRLLDLLIGHEKTRRGAAHRGAEPIAIGEYVVALRKQADRPPMVRVVLDDRRIEIPIRPPRVGAPAHRVAFPPVARANRSADRVEAAAVDGCARVAARLALHFRDDVDDAAQLAAVFGWITGGHHAQRLHVVGIQIRQERRRSVVGQRNTVNQVLRLVLAAPRVQNAVGLDDPARLRAHQVGERSSGQCRRSRSEGVCANAIDGARLMRIDEGVAGGHRHGCLHGRKVQHHAQVARNRGADVHQLGHVGESRLANFDAVHPVGQPRREHTSGNIGVEPLAKLIRLADQLDGGVDWQPTRIADCYAQLAGRVLAR